jgi:nitrous oxidase accessory protein NosD
MHTSSRPFGYTSLSLLGLLILSLEARATSNRVFMSTTGNNANDCSNPLTPCLDFAGALSQVNAGGEIVAEATGPYGPLTITKAVTISGPPGVVIYSGHQVTINAPGATVVLRGLTIDGNGANENGIVVQASGATYVESCVVANFGGNGILFGNGLLFVKDTVVRGMGGTGSGFGIWITPNSTVVKASIDHCRIEANQIGIFCNPKAIATVRHSVLAGNANTGAALGGDATAELNLENCVVANNLAGVGSDTGTVRVSNTTITDNGTGLYSLNGGSLVSRSNNTVEGNGTNGAFTGTYAAK